MSDTDVCDDLPAVRNHTSPRPLHEVTDADSSDDSAALGNGGSATAASSSGPLVSPIWHDRPWCRLAVLRDGNLLMELLGILPLQTESDDSSCSSDIEEASEKDPFAEPICGFCGLKRFSECDCPSSTTSEGVVPSLS